MYFTGDTHGDVFERIVKLKKTYDLTVGNHILIILGDFGLVWDDRWWKQTKYIERYIKDNKLNLEIISVIGNHENMDLIYSFKKIQKYNSTLIKVSDHISFFENGNIYHIDGQIFAVFGGALSIDKHLRTEGKTWWSEEIPNRETMQNFVNNLDIYHTDKLILLTHTTATDEIYYLDKYPMTDKLTDDVAKYLQFIKSNFKFKHHLHGHFHVEKHVPETNSTCLFKSIIKGSDIDVNLLQTKIMG